ncbi:MAG TPA: GNAT family N-acetyltransferase [Actinomycetota bacterium]
MTEVTIRALELADAEACDAIVLSLPYHFGQEAGRQQCAEAVRSEPGWVCQLDGRAVGFCTFARHLDTSGEITWLAVHADHRGSGLGTRLVDHLAAQMTAEGRRLLLALTVSASDGPDDVEDGYDATRAFYRSAGFVEARDFAGFWGQADTPVLMVRVLDP